MTLREFILPANHHNPILALNLALRTEPSLWQFDDRAKRYRNTKTGQFVGQRQMVELRDQFIQREKEVTTKLAGRLFNREITIEQWRNEMREVVRRAHSIEYMLARGGRNAMTHRDWGIIGQIVKGQYKYLDNFAQDIVGGRYKESQVNGVANRSGLYLESASQSFERAKGEGRGMPVLPAYPGDGSTVCKSNCRCFWRIVETGTAWECFWTMTPAEHCATCLERAERWNPLVVSKG